MSRHRKHLDFELNLVPFIDLLSTCICFLLMTAVWTQVGSLDTRQSMGATSTSDPDKKPTIWVQFENQGDLQMEVKEGRVGRDLARIHVKSVQGKMDLDRIETLLKAIRSQDPLVTTALIQPQASSVYEDIMDLMDRFKKGGVINLGVSPLKF